MNSQDGLEGLSRSELLRRLRDLEATQTSLQAHRYAGPMELTLQEAEVHAQTQRLRDMQSELDRSRDRYTELYDFAPIAYGTLDAGGVIREINLTGATLLGLERDHLIGHPLLRFVAAQDRAIFFEHLRRCREGAGQTSCELRLVAKPGRLFPAQLTTHTSNRAERDGLRYRTAIADMSEHHRVEEERRNAVSREAAARAAAETKDHLIAMVSHELRTPLAAVLLWTRILQIKLGSQSEQAHALDIIVRSAEAQRQLIDDLLDISRITTGKLRLQLKQLMPLALITGTVEAMTPTAHAKGVEVEVDIDAAIDSDDAYELWADPDRLRQVLWNLLSNAVKFTPGGGAVHVDVRRVGAELDLRVSDNGEGIDPSLLPHIFEAFRQGDSPITTRAHGGLGLGLAITKQLVEQHGGAIHASSDGIGRGATFVVRLPLRARAPAAQPTAQAGQARQAGPGGPTGPGDRAQARGAATTQSAVAQGHAALEGVRVLLVEDESATRSALQMLISAAGARVEAVDTAQAAIQSFQGSRPDILVGDIGMPEVDGYQMMQRLRALERTAASAPVPALALTAFASVADNERALTAGFDQHMSKPVEPVQLLTTLQRMTQARDVRGLGSPGSRGA